MTKHFKNFFLYNLIVLFFLGILGLVIFTSSLKVYYHISYPFILLLSFGVNLLIYHLFTRKPVAANRSLQLLGQSFAIKFFYYLGIAVVFLYTLTYKEEKISFVIFLFITYFAFTFIEVKALTLFIKSESNIS